MRFLRFISKIIKDELGLNFSFGSPSKQGDLTGAGLMLGSSILGSILGKNNNETIDYYPGLRTKFQDYLGSKLGKVTPYAQNPAFDLTQPEVEKSIEGAILGKLKNGVSNVSDYNEATKKYSEATKASMARSYADEMTKTKDMYNRLGLVSSTPGLEAQQDVNESQRIAENLFDSELMYKNLDRVLQAQGLDINELNSILSQGQILGQGQTAREEYGQQMSEEDLKRMIAEEQGYAGMSAGLLSSNPPTTIQTPNIWSNLANTGQDIGSLLLMSQILGK